MKQKKWTLAPQDDVRARILRTELGLGALASRILAARGVRATDHAAHFLDRSPERLHDPFLLADMQKTVDRIELASYRMYSLLYTHTLRTTL